VSVGRRERARDTNSGVRRTIYLNDDFSVGCRVYALVNGHVVICLQAAVPALIRGGMSFIRGERARRFPGARRRRRGEYCRAVVAVCVEVSRWGTFWPCSAIRQRGCCLLQVRYRLSVVPYAELSHSPRAWMMHVGGQIGGLRVGSSFTSWRETAWPPGRCGSWRAIKPAGLDCDFQGTAKGIN
jgi:hypothetical protein